MSLNDLKKNESNTNKGTDRGRETLRRSITSAGWAGAMLADNAGNILDGNHRLDIAKEQGIDPVIIKIDGKRPVVLQREDVDPGSVKATVLSTLINRSADLNHQYDQEAVMDQAQEAHLNPEDLGFTEQELTSPIVPSSGAADPTSSGSGSGSGSVGEVYTVIVNCQDEREQKALYERLKSEGLSVRVTTL